MEDLAKVMVDKPDAKGKGDSQSTYHDTGNLELLHQCPFVREPDREIRSGEDYTVHGYAMNPNDV